MAQLKGASTVKSAARKPSPSKGSELLQIDLLLAPSELGNTSLKGRTIVVVDVLRMCTSVCYALANGVERIIPVESIEAATQLAASLDSKETLLCGEREGERIEGFDLGNSPLEYTAEVVGGKTLIITTSNGTRVTAAGEGAREIAMGALVNSTAVAHWLIQRENPVMIICSGTLGRFALEDAVAAGLLVALLEEISPRPLLLGDAARAAAVLARSHRDDLPGMIERSENGRYLASRGFAEDLTVCAELDSLSTVPVLHEGRIQGNGSRSAEGDD